MQRISACSFQPCSGYVNLHAAQNTKCRCHWVSARVHDRVLATGYMRAVWNVGCIDANSCNIASGQCMTVLFSPPGLYLELQGRSQLASDNAGLNKVRCPNISMNKVCLTEIPRVLFESLSCSFYDLQTCFKVCRRARLCRENDEGMLCSLRRRQLKVSGVCSVSSDSALLRRPKNISDRLQHLFSHV